MLDISVPEIEDLLSQIEGRMIDDLEINVAIEIALPAAYHVKGACRPGSQRGKVVSQYENGRHGTWGAGDFMSKMDSACQLIDRLEGEPAVVLRAAVDEMTLQGVGDVQSWRYAFPRFIVIAAFRDALGRLKAQAEHEALP